MGAKCGFEHLISRFFFCCCWLSFSPTNVLLHHATASMRAKRSRDRRRAALHLCKKACRRSRIRRCAQCREPTRAPPVWTSVSHSGTSSRKRRSVPRPNVSALVNARYETPEDAHTASSILLTEGQDPSAVISQRQQVLRLAFFFFFFCFVVRARFNWL